MEWPFVCGYCRKGYHPWNGSYTCESCRITACADCCNAAGDRVPRKVWIRLLGPGGVDIIPRCPACRRRLGEGLRYNENRID